MKVTMIFSAITISIWILGMVLDIVGLYIGVKCASRYKVKSSKVGYFIMKLGEVLEGTTKETMVYIPVIFLVEFFKII